ncbi:hypothetical protein mvi_49740 [Methylobacterium indicum]|nr:hypothetical protein mvi_49740 [Methylobacterium indicum]
MASGLEVFVRRPVRAGYFPNVLWRSTMKWSMPVVAEVCVGMEVTSYESAEIDPFN